MAVRQQRYVLQLHHGSSTGHYCNSMVSHSGACEWHDEKLTCDVVDFSWIIGSKPALNCAVALLIQHLAMQVLQSSDDVFQELRFFHDPSVHGHVAAGGRAQYCCDVMKLLFISTL